MTTQRNSTIYKTWETLYESLFYRQMYYCKPPKTQCLTKQTNRNVNSIWSTTLKQHFKQNMNFIEFNSTWILLTTYYFQFEFPGSWIPGSWILIQSTQIPEPVILYCIQNLLQYLLYYHMLKQILDIPSISMLSFWVCGGFFLACWLSSKNISWTFLMV